MEHRSYSGFLIQQRHNEEAVKLFSFVAYAKDLASWAGINRIAERQGGTQRLLAPSRVASIKQFISRPANTKNTVPSAVIVAFDPDTVVFTPMDQNASREIDSEDDFNDRVVFGKITFDFQPGVEDHLKPGLIVDGQHRILGLAQCNENIPIVVTALVDADKVEQAFQFIVINKKAVAVKANTAKSIIADLDSTADGLLSQRLSSARIQYSNTSPLLSESNDSPESPFLNLIDWEYNRSGARIIQTSAIESSAKQIEKIYDFEGDVDTFYEVFFAIWRQVKERFIDVWNGSSALLKKVTMVALTTYIVEELKFSLRFGLLDITNPTDIARKTQTIIELIPSDFFSCPWVGIDRIQDNANVRSLIVSDLRKSVENVRKGKGWSEDLDLFNAPDEI